jgi:site-specific recombinase XerD
MEKHLALRAAVGRVGQADESCLYGLNEFLHKKYPKLETLSRVVILEYLESKKNLSIAGRRNAVIYIRQFCRFLVGRGIKCYVPDRTLAPKYEYRPRYCPLNENDVLAIMKEARLVRANRPFIGETYATMLGLLWCTGMRRREIVRLRHDDVDLDQGVLIIRQTKFFKDRLIPLGPSVVRALKDYRRFKEERGDKMSGKAFFFVTLAGQPMPGHSLSTTFNRIVRRLGIKNAEGRRAALHDFRHNFATQTMARIYREPEKFPVTPSMARLATYLGHTSIFYTQYYLHPDFNLMQDAAAKFGWSDR